MINVTKSYLPSLEVYVSHLEKIWKSGWLTNNGPLLQQLEKNLKEYLGVKHLFVCSNGTIALQIAIRSLELKGEIITTPYSYVATLNSIIWENCTPVFADINLTDFNLDPDSVISKITKNTKAILATHVYGNPCDVKKLKDVSDRYDLKIIYDGAHAFSGSYEGQPILNYGDVSTCSLHATKLFHTVEGGLMVTSDDEIAKKIFLLRQFGHDGESYFGLGINGKNSEFHAAMGLSIFPDLPLILEKRKEVIGWYNQYLNYSKIQRPVPLAHTAPNFSFMPVIFQSEEELINVKNKLTEIGVNARRYFYPSLNVLPHVNYQSCPQSESVALRALCLPLYVGLKEEEVRRIASAVNEELG